MNELTEEAKVYAARAAIGFTIGFTADDTTRHLKYLVATAYLDGYQAGVKWSKGMVTEKLGAEVVP
jgi:hypothetical protein